MERQRKGETPLLDESPPPKKIDVSYDNFLFSEDLHDVVFEFEEDANNVIGMSPVQACEVDHTCNCPKNNDDGESTPLSHVQCGCNNEKLSKIKKETIPAHAQILAFNSEVFRTQLFGNLQERTIKITDASADNFRTLLRCIYTRELHITTENMFELAYLANKYMIPKITHLVGVFFKEQLDKDENFWKLFRPERISLVDDEEKSLLNVLLTRFESDTSKYLSSADFLLLHEEIVGQLVRCDPLAIKEADLYKAVIRWAEFQCKRDGMSPTENNMRSHVKGFVHSLRMPTLSRDELFYNGGILTNKLLLYEEKVNLTLYCNGLISTDTPFVKIPRRKSRDVIACTAELIQPSQVAKAARRTTVVPNANFRFVGVTYVLDIQKIGDVPETITTEVRCSETFLEKSEDYDLLCSFEWVANPGMEVSNYEVVSMPNDIIMFSADRYYRIISRPSAGITMHYFGGDFKDASSQVYLRRHFPRNKHPIKSVHFLPP